MAASVQELGWVETFKLFGGWLKEGFTGFTVIVLVLGLLCLAGFYLATKKVHPGALGAYLGLLFFSLVLNAWLQNASTVIALPVDLHPQSLDPRLQPTVKTIGGPMQERRLKVARQDQLTVSVEALNDAYRDLERERNLCTTGGPPEAPTI